MTRIAGLPSWTESGILPPIMPGAAGNCRCRSPYLVSLKDFVQQFGTNLARIAILEGFLQFRGELHKLGLASGFQWVNGSFVENVELMESRPPNDLDVVTFYDAPLIEDRCAFLDQYKQLFDHGYLKVHYNVDGYFFKLGKIDSDKANYIAYWYSLWSHRRDNAWKGFVQIDLAPAEDADAKGILNTIKGEADDTQ